MGKLVFMLEKNLFSPSQLEIYSLVIGQLTGNPVPVSGFFFPDTNFKFFVLFFFFHLLRWGLPSVNLDNYFQMEWENSFLC